MQGFLVPTLSGHKISTSVRLSSLLSKTSFNGLVWFSLNNPPDLQVARVDRSNFKHVF